METLDEVIREYLIEQGKDSLHEYPRYLQLAIRGLKDINYDVSGVMQTKPIKVDSMHRAVLPTDVINIVRMGFLGADKKITEIYRDDRILTNYNQLISCGSDPAVAKAFPYNGGGSPTIDWANHYRNGENIGRYYGNEGGSVYGYSLDYSTGVIEFSSNVSGYVFIQYIGDPKKVDGQYMVHPWLVEPIKDWIEWSSKRRKPNVSRGEIADLQRVYENSKHEAAIRFYSESLGSLYNAARKTFNGSAKY